MRWPLGFEILFSTVRDLWVLVDHYGYIVNCADFRWQAIDVEMFRALLP